MTPLEKKLTHILFDEDITDIKLSKKDMEKAGVNLYDNKSFIKIIKGLEKSYLF